MSIVEQSKKGNKLQSLEPGNSLDQSELQQPNLDVPKDDKGKKKSFTKQFSLKSASNKAYSSIITPKIDENTQVEPRRHIFEWKNIFTLVYTVIYGICCVLVYLFRSKTVKEPVPIYNGISDTYEFKCIEGRPTDDRFDLLLLAVIVILLSSIFPLIVSFLNVHQCLENFLNKYFECHCSRPVYFIIGLILIFISNFLHLIANFFGDREQHGRYFCSLSTPITAESRLFNNVTFGMSWTTNIAILIIHTFGQPLMYYLVSRSNKVKSTETSMNKIETGKLSAKDDSTYSLREANSKPTATHKLTNDVQS